MNNDNTFDGPDGFQKAFLILLAATLRQIAPVVLAFALGVGLTAGVVAFRSYSVADPPLTDLRFTAPASSALTVDHLTAKVAPIIQQKLIEAKPDILEHAGGPIERTAIRLAYPLAVREVPAFTQHGIEAVADEFGRYSVKDLIEFFENHAAASAEPGGGRLLTELRSARR